MGARTRKQMKKTRVAVLGAGCSSMAAVWGLLNSEQADQYEITVYQYGWRIGGKGASGRNAEYGQRIEEHGLHIWGGCYENAFQIMQDVYGRLDRNPTLPLSVWYDPTDQSRSAFWPHDLITLAEYLDGGWQYWNVEMPSNDDLPGNGHLLPSLSSYIGEIVELMIEALIGADLMVGLEHCFAPFTACAPFESIEKLIDAAGRALEKLLGRELDALTAARLVFRAHTGGDPYSPLKEAAHALSHDPTEHTRAHYDAILLPLQDLLHLFTLAFDHLLDEEPGLRHVYEMLDFGTALITGVIEDGVLLHGFDVVDGLEFTAWLGQHGASEYTQQGALVRGWHDFFFANKDGDPALPSMSAASALRTIFRYVFTYKGAFFWKMQAGMGDTIFAPLYQYAVANGVRFEFFHRVEEVSNLDAKGKPTDTIQRIRVARQVDLADKDKPYDPLVTVKKVPSWPSEPIWEQIDPDQAAKLQAGKINLESWWADWKPVEHRTLELGKDFDLVILGISVAALPPISKDLMATSDAYAQQLTGVATNQTLALQLWFQPSLKQLGWSHPSTVGTVQAEPHTTWANMDQLLDKEDWSDVDDPPGSVVYWCGTFRDAPEIPPRDVHWFPETQDALVKGISLAWCLSNMRTLYPHAAAPHTSPGLDFELLTVKGTPDGEARFDQQFWRANIDPSERYVLSLPDTAQYRLRSDESGFTNLYLAGDWLYTGFNAGCVEGAVMGGLQASQAISGFPERIVGDGESGYERR